MPQAIQQVAEFSNLFSEISIDVVRGGPPCIIE